LPAPTHTEHPVLTGPLDQSPAHPYHHSCIVHWHLNKRLELGALSYSAKYLWPITDALSYREKILWAIADAMLTSSDLQQNDHHRVH